MNKLILSFLTISLLTLSTCSDNPVTDDTQPGRRDYAWTIDTLIIPEGRSYPSLMWGASAYNIWALGTAYANAYQIWHFNGTKWENYVPDKYIDPRGICGFSGNNIWTSSLGTSSLPAAFWHYNGSKWSKFCDITIESYYHITIQSIAGNDVNNIYAVGFADSINGQSYKAIIFHFNGTAWTQVNIPIIQNSFVQIFYDLASSSFLIAGNTFETINQYIYNFDGNSIREIYSTQEGVLLCSIGNSIYLQSDGKLLKYQNSGFNLFKDFSSQNYTGNAWGRGEKDFFTINWDGIGHYNGTDLITIYKKWNDDWFPGGGILFERDVFFIWDDSFNTFIIHGKLKD